MSGAMNPSILLAYGWVAKAVYDCVEWFMNDNQLNTWLKFGLHNGDYPSQLVPF
jgi:hypothetical protein